MLRNLGKMKKTLIFALFFVQWFDVVKAETPDEEPYQTLENLLPESASDISIYRWTLLDGTDETKTSYMPQRFCELLNTNEGGRYALLMPTDEALMSYVDAASLDGYSNPRMISILWKDGDFPIRTENYRYDAATGTVGRRLTGALASLNQSATVDYLSMMQKSHTIAFTRPEDAEKGLNSGNRYFQTMDGSVIKIQKNVNGDLIKVQGAFQMQNEEAGLETFSQCAVEETWHKGNFDLYEIAQPVIHSPHSVQWVLKGDETDCPFAAFYNLTCADKECLTACGFTNVEELLPYISSLEDRLNYTSDAPFTLFVPTNEAIEQEIAKGLPTWESIRTHIDGHTTSDANGNIVWDSEESRLSVAKECLTLINFIKAHVMMGVEIADQLPFTRTHASALTNSTGEAAQLEVSSEGNEQMTVSDGEHVRTVLTNKNIFTVDKVRNYPPGPVSSTSARVFSYHPGVIHQIDGVLSYNKGDIETLLPEDLKPQYQPFLEDGIAWIDGIGHERDGYYRTSGVSLGYYTTKGDTLINDKSYYRVCQTKICITNINTDLDEQGNEYVKNKWLDEQDTNICFYMREDESGDVWLYVDDESVFEKLSGNTLYEYLADKLVNRDLFLFNNKKTYAIGDKQPFGVIAWEYPDPEPNWWEGDFWYIDSREVMEVNDNIMHDGKKHRTYTYGIYYNGEKYLGDKFVQGVGPLWYGPLSGLGSPNNSYQRNFFAFYRNGQLIYRNEGYVSALEEYFPDILDELAGKKTTEDLEYQQLIGDDEVKIWTYDVVDSERKHTLMKQFHPSNPTTSQKNGKKYYTLEMKTINDGNIQGKDWLYRQKGGKIYFFDEEKEQEVLLMDFGLKEGNTFRREYDTFTVEAEVTAVYDTTMTNPYLGNTYTAKVIKLQGKEPNAWFQDTWIEGVGSIRTGLYPTWEAYPSDIYLLQYDSLTPEEEIASSIFTWPNVPQCLKSARIKSKEVDVTKEEYKKYYSGNTEMFYEFVDDTLHVWGVIFRNCAASDYALCLIGGDNRLQLLSPEPPLETTCNSLVDIDVKFSGFEPGEYLIKRYDESDTILVCNGKDIPNNKWENYAYRPFVEEGKTWMLGWRDPGETPSEIHPSNIMYQYLQGDTIIDGQQCKQLWWSSYNGEKHGPFLAIYEKNRQVFVIYPSSPVSHLHYDFLTPFGNHIDFTSNSNGVHNSTTCTIGEKTICESDTYKGVCTEILPPNGENFYAVWRQGVGYSGFFNISDILKDQGHWELMSCTVGDEVLYYDTSLIPQNLEVKKKRLDFTHVIKAQPKAPRHRAQQEGIETLKGEYSDSEMFVRLNNLAGTYAVTLADATGHPAYTKEVLTDNVLALKPALSSYTPGVYTLTVENEYEKFVTILNLTTDIASTSAPTQDKGALFDLSGRRLQQKPTKGIYIQNGKKVLVK